MVTGISYKDDFHLISFRTKYFPLIIICYFIATIFASILFYDSQPTSKGRLVWTLRSFVLIKYRPSFFSRCDYISWFCSWNCRKQAILFTFRESLAEGGFKPSAVGSLRENFNTDCPATLNSRLFWWTLTCFCLFHLLHFSRFHLLFLGCSAVVQSCSYGPHIKKENMCKNL